MLLSTVDKNRITRRKIDKINLLSTKLQFRDIPHEAKTLDWNLMYFRLETT